MKRLVKAVIIWYVKLEYLRTVNRVPFTNLLFGCANKADVHTASVKSGSLPSASVV